MKRQTESKAPSVSLFETVSIIVISNLREWLPIKSTSMNKLALQFERLMTSKWVAKPTALAFEERDDGIGAQLHGQISVIVESRKCGLPYSHKTIEHAQFIEDDSELERWISAFNFEAQDEINLPSGAERISMRDYVRWPFGQPGSCIVEAPHMHRAAESDPDFYERVCKDLRKHLRFQAPNKKDKNTPLRVALHVRRGDVSGTENSKRFTSLSVVCQSVIELVDLLQSTEFPFTLELHSQGEESDFADLLLVHPMVTYLNSDPLETMQRLISADILVTAKSSFSQIAALMSEGIVLYEPYWQKPLAHWHIRQLDGAIGGRLQDDIVSLVAARKMS